MGCCNKKTNKCESCPDESSGMKECSSDSDCKKESFSNTGFSLYNYGVYSIDGNFTKNKKVPGDLNKWIHQEGYTKDNVTVNKGPVYMYSKIVQKYGKPDVIANQPRGICIWYIEQKNGDVHHSIILKDEYVSHCVPAKHNDFLYSYINIYVPPEKLKQVLSVSGSVGYDGLQKLIYARCASFEANMATLASVFLVLNNKDPNYVYNIKNRYDSFENNTKLVKSELKKNQRKYREQLSMPYYDLAFPDGCK